MKIEYPPLVRAEKVYEATVWLPFKPVTQGVHFLSGAFASMEMLLMHGKKLTGLVKSAGGENYRLYRVGHAPIQFKVNMLQRIKETNAIALGTPVVTAGTVLGIVIKVKDENVELLVAKNRILEVPINKCRMVELHKDK